MTYKKPELLISASSLEVLRTAVMFGADAVYIGGEAFGLRAKAKNFSSEDSNGTMYESSDISQEKIYKAMQAIHDFGYSIISIGVGKTRFHLRIICGI